LVGIGLLNFITNGRRRRERLLRGVKPPEAGRNIRPTRKKGGKDWGRMQPGRGSRGGAGRASETGGRSSRGRSAGEEGQDLAKYRNELAGKRGGIQQFAHKYAKRSFVISENDKKKASPQREWGRCEAMKKGGKPLRRNSSRSLAGQRVSRRWKKKSLGEEGCNLTACK